MIARLALAMSVSPALQNRSKPAPEPMLSIVMFPAYPSSLNRSAIASASGYTVELPAMMMSPFTSSGFTSGSIIPAAAGAAVGAAVGSGAFVGSVTFVGSGALVGSGTFVGSGAMVGCA